MPSYFIQNRTSQRLYVPPPVNKTFAPNANATVYVAAAEMEIQAIRGMVAAGLINVTASDNQRLSDDLEVPVLSMIHGGGGGVASVSGLSPIASSGGANPVISLSGTVPVNRGGTGITAAGTAGNVLTSDGTGWVSSALPAGVASVGATAPLESSGGSSPVISLTGIVSAANGGTGLSAPGALGNILTSDGAGGWTSAAPSFDDDWTRTGTVLSPKIPGDTVQVEVGFGTVGISVSDTPGSFRTELSPAVVLLTDNLKAAELSASSALLKLRGDTAESIAPVIRAVDFDESPTALDLQIRELAVNTNPGNNGDVLTSSGAGSAPTWTNPASTHEGYDTLVHNLAESNFQEVSYSSGFVSAITYWTDSGKTLKIRESLFNYTVDDLISSVVERQFDGAGVQVAQLVHTYSYNPDETLASITTVRT